MYSYNCAISVGDGDEREAFVISPNSPRGVVLMLHGMAEHKERYRELARYLSGAGYATVCYDQAGHGVSLPEERRTGLLANKRGYELVVDQVALVRKWVEREFPQLPCVLLGHSFGSFVARACMKKFGKHFAGFVFCGTASHPGLRGQLGRLVAEILVTVSGPERRSSFLWSMTIGGNNTGIEAPRTAFDWLSRDSEEVDAYIADSACGFVPCTAFFRDMIVLLLRVCNIKYLGSNVADRPVLLLTGGRDPVSNMGGAAARVMALLRDVGVTRINSRVYPGARHELFHETNRWEVFRDLVKWLNRAIVSW